MNANSGQSVRPFQNQWCTYSEMAARWFHFEQCAFFYVEKGAPNTKILNHYWCDWITPKQYWILHYQEAVQHRKQCRNTYYKPLSWTRLSLDELKAMPPKKVEKAFYPPENLHCAEKELPEMAINCHRSISSTEIFWEKTSDKIPYPCQLNGYWESGCISTGYETIQLQSARRAFVDMHGCAALLLILLNVITELWIHKWLVRLAAFLQVFRPEEFLVDTIAKQLLLDVIKIRHSSWIGYLWFFGKHQHLKRCICQGFIQWPG